MEMCCVGPVMPIQKNMIHTLTLAITLTNGRGSYSGKFELGTEFFSFILLIVL